MKQFGEAWEGKQKLVVRVGGAELPSVWGDDPSAGDQGDWRVDCSPTGVPGVQGSGDDRRGGEGRAGERGASTEGQSAKGKGRGRGEQEQRAWDQGACRGTAKA